MDPQHILTLAWQKPDEALTIVASPSDLTGKETSWQTKAQVLALACHIVQEKPGFVEAVRELSGLPDPDYLPIL